MKILESIISLIICTLLFGCENHLIHRHNEEGYRICNKLHNKNYCDKKIQQCHKFSLNSPVCGIVDFGDDVEELYQKRLRQK